MARYLVTGAAGFIASRISDLLLSDGHEVIGIDNLNDAYDPRMKYYRLEKLRKRDNFIFYQEDIANRAALDKIFSENKDIDAVMNLAARAGVRACIENPFIFFETNALGTLNLLELCKRYQVNKFVLASTSSIYGANPPYPTPEDADSSHPLQVYAATKKAAEVTAHTYHHLDNIDVTVFRYFTVYGPAGRPDLALFRFVQWIAEGRTVRINGDGLQTRGFTYLDDIARGTILGLKPLGYEIINLGGHESISMIDLIHMIEEMVGKKAIIEHNPFHPADVRSNLADVSKACNLLGWEPRVSLREGVQNLVDWYLSERLWASQLLTP